MYSNHYSILIRIYHNTSTLNLA